MPRTGRKRAARLEVIGTQSPYLLIVAAALAFAPAIAGSWHLDDYSMLGDAAYGHAAELAFSRVRPLTNLTMWANFQAGGESPLGFHLVNLLLHLVAVWFARDALRRLLPAAPALLAATVFALHPLQTEPVAYVYSRTTVLCGLFCWAAIASWARERHWLAVGATALALLAKEEAVALPVFFALLSGRRLPWRPVGAMFALALATGLRGLVATGQVQGSGAGLAVAMSPVTYLLGQGTVIWRYLRLLVLPVGLNFDPDLTVSPVLGALGWLALLGLGVWLWRSRPPAGFWFAAGLVFLAPTSTVLPIDDLAADRRMYLAGACFAAAGALLLPRLRAVHVAALGLILGGLSFSRALVFQTEEALWRDTVARSPEKVRPRIQLARAVSPSEAIGLLAGLPGDALVSAERGRVYLELQQPAEALREFGAALAAEPGDPRALTNRGTALAALGQLPAARQDFARALERDPCFYAALANLRQLGLPLPPVARCRFTPLQQKALGL